ncbi:MAG TPA: ABC transporter substrate-binding protein [Burkholderiales bacterium]|nr:ABC transporter substrate-binding protein [Burkholderiales bacterium]
MNRHTFAVSSLVAIVLCGFLAAVRAAPVAGAPSELKIGVVAFLSGPASGPFGIPSRNAAELWIDKINKEGGIGGVKLVPVFTDEAGPADKVVTEFRRLVLDEKVSAVMGYISSANCLAVPPVADELKVLTILSDCGTDRVFEEGKHPYVFRTNAHTVIDGVGAARYVLAMNPNVKTIAGVNQDYAWGRDSWEVFQRSIRKLKPNVKVVDALWPKLFAGEYSAEISKLLVEKPDVVFTSFWGGDLVTFAGQAKARGLLESSMVVVNNTGSDIKDLAPGMLIGSRGPHGIVSPEMEKNALRKQFIELYRQKYGLAPNNYIAHGAYHYIQALQGLRAAYEKAIKTAGRWPTGEQVAAAFEHVEFDSPSGHIAMAIGGGHQAIEPAGYAVIKFDPALGVNTFSQIRVFSARCVNPPDGMKSLDWIDRGFPGAQCP